MPLALLFPRTIPQGTRADAQGDQSLPQTCSSNKLEAEDIRLLQTIAATTKPVGKIRGVVVTMKMGGKAAEEGEEQATVMAMEATGAILAQIHDPIKHTAMEELCEEAKMVEEGRMKNSEGHISIGVLVDNLWHKKR